MKVAEIMNPRPRTILAAESLHAATRAMVTDHCGWLPVVTAAGRVVGVLTDRDILVAAYETGKPLAEIGVERAMTATVRSCGPDDDLEAVETLMRAHRVRRVPVTDGQGQLCGFVSLSDLARGALAAGAADHGLIRAEVAETLAAVASTTRVG